VAKLCLFFCLRIAAPYLPNTHLSKHRSDVIPILVSKHSWSSKLGSVCLMPLEKERAMKVSKSASILLDQLSQRTLSEHKSSLKQERLSDRPAAIRTISVL
jgi:hypothetical protein